MFLVEVALEELGFNKSADYDRNVQRMFVVHQDSLQRRFKDNIHAIQEASFNAENVPTNFALEVFEYIIGQGDFRVKAASYILTQKPHKVVRAQVLLRYSGYPVNISGKIDELTIKSAVAYINEYKAMNDTHFAYTFNEAESPIFRYEIDYRVIKHDIESENIPILNSELPPDAKTPEALANFLTNEKNYQAYYEAIYRLDYSSLNSVLNGLINQ